MTVLFYLLVFFSAFHHVFHVMLMLNSPEAGDVGPESSLKDVYISVGGRYLCVCLQAEAGLTLSSGVSFFLCLITSDDRGLQETQREVQLTQQYKTLRRNGAIHGATVKEKLWIHVCNKTQKSNC